MISSGYQPPSAKVATQPEELFNPGRDVSMNPIGNSILTH